MLSAYKAALDKTGAIIAGVKPEHLTASTPCNDFDCKALLNHIIGGNYMLAEVAAGKTIETGGELPDFAGNDPAGAYKKSAEAAFESWSQPGALDQIVHFPFGDMPAQQGLGIAILETTVHGWDVAKATGQDATIDPALAGMMLGGMKAMGTPEGFRGEQGSGSAFGPEIKVPDAAGPAEQLLGFLGRKA